MTTTQTIITLIFAALTLCAFIGLVFSLRDIISAAKDFKNLKK